ncbi:ExbD/TolR family protein [Emcibacter sp.]|uniref:ExbD/TolR family protein n=1 Tax=Emcibacter sp. TaxID=1979954 RepID=UPI003A8F06C3
MKFSRQQRKTPPENVIPLINIVFLLLVFFMVAGHMERQSPVSVTPPVSGQKNVVAETEQQLFLSTGGRVVWGGQTYDQKEFYAQFEKQQFLKGISRLVIRADRSVPANDFLRLLEDVRRLGVKNVHLVTRVGKAQ